LYYEILIIQSAHKDLDHVMAICPDNERTRYELRCDEESARANEDETTQVPDAQPLECWYDEELAKTRHGRLAF
jgi:hypothetical protein